MLNLEARFLFENRVVIIILRFPPHEGPEHTVAPSASKGEINNCFKADDDGQRRTNLPNSKNRNVMIGRSSSPFIVPRCFHHDWKNIILPICYISLLPDFSFQSPCFSAAVTSCSSSVLYSSRVSLCTVFMCFFRSVFVIPRHAGTDNSYLSRWVTLASATAKACRAVRGY